MANGPGLSWGAGVADARPSELPADALSTSAAQASCQTGCNIYNSEALPEASAPGASLTLPEPSGTAISSEAVDTRGSKADSAAPAGTAKSATPHRVRFDEPSSSGATPAPLPALQSFPAPHAALSSPQHQGADTAAADLSAAPSNSERSGGPGDDGGSGTTNAGGRSQAAGATPRPVDGGEDPPVSSGDGGSGSGCGDAAREAGNNGGSRKAGVDASRLPSSPASTAAGSGAGAGNGGSGSGGNGGGSGGGGGLGPQVPTLEPSSSMLEHVSREVIRKLRLAASAGSAEDRHVVCEELFADITCALDASAQAALLGPQLQAMPELRGGGGGGDGGEVAVARGGAAAAALSGGGGDGGASASPGVVGEGGGGSVLPAGRRGSVRGRLYYEVLAVYYASRAAADSARALLHLCQLLWDTPWVAPIYALLLHRFLLLPREVGGAVTSPTGAAATATAAAAGGRGAGSVPRKPSYGTSYSDPLVKHLNVLAHGTRQLLLGDVHSGLSRFQPLWAFLALEVAGLGPQRAGGRGGGSNGGGNGAGGPAAVALPPVTKIDALPVAARPWLLAVAAAFLPYYCLDEQVSELARRFPPPLPLEGGGGGGLQAATASLAGFDFLVVEVTDVLGRINSEAGLLKYLRALRALARPPPPPPMPPPPLSITEPTPAPLPPRGPQEQGAPGPHVPGGDGAGSTPSGRGGMGGGATAVAAPASGLGAGRRTAAAASRARSSSLPAPPLPLDGLPTITKLRLQNELYSLTSGGGPRYAPPEVRRAAFAALDALSPGGRSLRWLVRWASRTLHLEWLEGDSGGSDDPWAGRGWLGWIYWPIHWCTALYGKILLAIFQIIYGMVVWRAWRRGAAEVASVAGTGGAITMGRGGGGGGGVAGGTGDGSYHSAGAVIGGVAAAVDAAAAAAAAGRPSGGGAGTGADEGRGGTRGAAGVGDEGSQLAEGQPAAPSAGGSWGSKAGPWWQPRLRG